MVFWKYSIAASRAPTATSDWLWHLQWILLGLQAALWDDSGISAAKFIFSMPLELPGQFLTAVELPLTFFVEQLNSVIPCVALLSPPTDPDPQHWPL
jgi:hypothetical protein